MASRRSLLGWAAPDNKVLEPSSGFKTTGWSNLDEPPAEYFNWFWNQVSALNEHIDKHVPRNYLNWTELTTGISTALNDIAYGGGVYVAVGASGVILTSEDLVTWTTRTNPEGTTALNAITYGGSLFVAVGQTSGGDAVILTSPDGTTWTERSNPQNAHLKAVAYHNGLFVAVGSSFGGTSAYIISSANGTSWTDRSVAQNVSNTCLMYDDVLGLWIAVGGTHFFTSANGTSWTATSWTLPTGGLVGLFRVEDRVYAVADDEYTYTENGTSWSTPASCPSGSLLSVHGYEDVTVMVFGGGQDLYARDDEAGWSGAVADWRRVAFPGGHELVRHAGDRWFAFGATGEAVCSLAA